MLGRKARPSRASSGAVIVLLACALSACGGKSSRSADNGTSVDVADRGTLTLLSGALGGPGYEDGIGALARFEDPRSLVSEGPNTLYIADNRMIRRVDVESREVTTLWFEETEQGPPSGDGNGQGGEASGLASDGAGNLYFADATNHNIRRLNLASGTFTTIAGSAGLSGTSDGVGAAARFHGPVDLACDRAGSLFVSDHENGTIRKLELTTGAVSTLAGLPGATQSQDGVGAAAAIPHPTALALDGRGNLYLADDSGIRKIVIETAEVSTLARWLELSPNFPFVFGQPGTLAVDAASGALYFADWGGSRVLQVDVVSGAPTSLAGRLDTALLSHGFRFADGVAEAARFAGPMGVTTDNQGHLYIIDGCCTVRALDEASATVSTLAGLPPSYGPTDGTATEARFTVPRGLASDAQGNLFVADQADHTLRRIAAGSGEVSTIAGSAYLNGTDDGVGSAARFYAPTGLVLDHRGSLYVTDYSNGAIRRLELATGKVSTVVAAPLPSDANALRLSGAEYLALDGAGNLYVISELSIYKIVLANGALSRLYKGSYETRGSSDGPLAAASFYSPHGIASDGANALYLADTYNHTIRKIDLTTEQVTTIAGLAGESGIEDGVGRTARFYQPTELAYDGHGHGALYVADHWTVRRLELATGRVTTMVGSALEDRVVLGALPGGLVEPGGLALLPNGDLAIVNEQAILRARF